MTKSAKRKAVPKSVKRETKREKFTNGIMTEEVENTSLIESLNRFKENFSPWHLLFLLPLIYFIPFPIFFAPSTGLDPSWRISLNMAIDKGLIFGKDIVFTYGPLGYLETRIPELVSRLPIILFQIFIYINAIVFILFWINQEPVKRKWEKLNLVFIPFILLAFGPALFIPSSITLFFYSLFYMILYLKRRDILILPILSICCLLSFYMKVNTGIVGNFLFVVFMLFILLRKYLPVIPFLIITAVHFAILYFASYGLNTDFSTYISNSMDIISAYNDAMFELQNLMAVILGSVGLVLLIYPFIWSIENIYKSILAYFLLFLFGAHTYILFKQGFTRSDMEHNTIYFSMINFIAILIYISFPPIQKRLPFLAYLLPIALICVVGSKFNQFLSSMASTGQFIEEMSDPEKKIRLQETYAESRKLAPEMLEIIQDSTVDLLGFETCYMYYNDLNYTPRPVFQSYSAFSPELIQQNVDFFNGEKAPEYIIYHFGTIDGRNHFWEEPKSFIPILSHYTVRGSMQQNNEIGPLMLFDKRDTILSVESRELPDAVAKLNEDFTVPVSDQILYMSMEYEYTLLGRIRRFLFQPDVVRMKIWEENENFYDVRLVLPVMQSGVPINKSVKHFGESVQFFNSLGKGNLKIVRFQIMGDPLWIKDEFKLHFTEYKIGQ